MVRCSPNCPVQHRVQKLVEIITISRIPLRQTKTKAPKHLCYQKKIAISSLCSALVNTIERLENFLREQTSSKSAILMRQAYLFMIFHRLSLFWKSITMSVRLTSFPGSLISPLHPRSRGAGRWETLGTRLLLD